MGWNDLVVDRPHPVLDGIGRRATTPISSTPTTCAVRDPGERLAHCDYGGAITAIVGRDTMVGTQFHPEKSQAAGLRLIANFLTGGPER